MKIAVVGIGCHYPGAQTARALFENLLAGRRYFREMPPERWKLDDYYHPDKKRQDATYNKKAALIEGFEFDCAEFKIPRSVYRATDTAQWLALKVSRDALRDAALNSLPAQRTAVIIGNTLTGEVSRASVLRFRWPYVQRVLHELLDSLSIAGRYREQVLAAVEARYKAPFAPVNEDNLAGSLSNTIAGRIANFFGLNGGAYTTDGACSSSLLAINQACIGLERHDFDLALSGGVDISLDPFELVGFAKVGALAERDIQVYDQNASGFLPGEGSGIVVLKRLADALVDGNRIYAVVNGVGMSSDGKGGITAPNVNGQSLAVDRAYKAAGYSFADVELIEGHGTGTSVGDSVELTTFNQAKARWHAEARHRCGIGSIKSNIGHTKAAAGVAGFIKATLAVYYGLLPPSMGINTPNRLFTEGRHLYPLLCGKVWPGHGHRRAAVSSAGFGGINIHVALSSSNKNIQAPAREVEALKPLLHAGQDTEVFLIGAQSVTQLRERLALILTAAPRISQAELTDLAFFCAERFGPGSAGDADCTGVRLGIVAADPEQLTSKLENVQARLQAVSDPSAADFIDLPAGICLTTAVEKAQPLKIAFLFPGQGSQSLNMLDRLRARDAKAAEIITACDNLLKGSVERSIAESVYRDTDSLGAEPLAAARKRLSDTRIAQPAIVAASMAGANYLEDLGIAPAYALGHSLGEYAALWSAQALTTADVIKLVATRGRAMATSSAVLGAMLSVAADAERVAALIPEVVGYITISNINSPQQTVVSGEASTIDSFLEICNHHGLNAARLPVSNAFHSRLMGRARDAMKACLQRQRFQPLQHPVVSSMTGELVGDAADIPQLLLDQILNPVKFTVAVDTLRAAGCNLFVEVGPGAVLSGLVRSIWGTEQAPVFSADIGARGEHSFDFNNMLAFAYARGLALSAEKVFKGRFIRPFDLPYRPRFIASPCENPVPPLDLQKAFDLHPAQPPLAEVDSIEPQADEADAGEAAVDSSVAAIEASLKAFIVSQYGYSANMVTSQARLQEHLGLDSLKFAEVAFETMAGLGVRGDITGLGDISIAELADYLFGLLSAKAENDDYTESGNAPLLPHFHPWVRAFEQRLMPQTLDRGSAQVPEGCVLLAALRETPLLKALTAKCRDLGLNTRYLIGNHMPVLNGVICGCIVLADNDSAEELLAGAREAAENPLAMNAEPLRQQLYLKRLYRQPELLLRAAKVVLAHRPTAAHSCFVLVTQGGGNLGESAHQCAGADLLTGAGFVKSLHLENRAIKTRVIDLNPALAETDKTDIIVNEMLYGEGHADVGYTAADARMTAQLKPCFPALMAEQHKGLKAGDVVLITGGGKGITAECALALAVKYGLKLALVGASAAPAGEADADAAELLQNLRRFEAHHIEYRYYQCNVADAASVAKLVQTVAADFGSIDGLIHAAGLNTPHRIDSLQWPQFLRILRPKMEGLLNLLQALDLRRVKTVMAFSSVIAYSGMAGNSDYAYANEWMDNLLKRLQSLYPHINCLSYAFSVWAGVGMGARMSSVDLLGGMGISAIPLAEGVRKFVELAARQWPRTSLILASRLGNLDTLAFCGAAAAANTAGNRFLEKVLYHQPGIELVSEVFLHPDTDTYLADHNYDGSLLFPAVMGIEAMAECAKACLGGAAEAVCFNSGLLLENVQLERAIIVPAAGRAIRIYARAEEPAADRSRRVRIAIRSSVTHYEVDYFSAECVWSPRRRTLPERRINQRACLNLDPRTQLYGKVLFQGAVFQNIDCYQELSEKHCVVRINTPRAGALFPAHKLFLPLLGYPQVRDTFLHAVQLCVPRFKILPVAIERMTFIDHNSERLFLSAVERERTASEFVYDIEVYDSEGRGVESLSGFRCRIMGDYEDAENLSLIYTAHSQSKSLGYAATGVAG